MHDTSTSSTCSGPFLGFSVRYPTKYFLLETCLRITAGYHVLRNLPAPCAISTFSPHKRSIINVLLPVCNFIFSSLGFSATFGLCNPNN
ncbi:hypothetical protein Hanom_Chr05g00436891 [Helianthus anomalus]